MGKLNTLQLNKYNSVGAIHIHSVYSDGTGNIDSISKAAKKAGLDWIIVTDHNSFDIEEGIYNGVYVIKGEEISPKNENHYLALGINEYIQPSDNAQHNIEAVKLNGGFGFAAHPEESDCRRNSHQPIKWTNKNIIPDGVEIWNWFSEWADNLDDGNIFSLIYSYLFKNKLVKSANSNVLFWWDNLNNVSEKIVPAIGGIDAHALKIKDYIEENKEFYMKPSFGNVVMTDRVCFDFINEDDLIVYSPANDRDTNAEEVKAAAGNRKVYLYLPSFCPEEDAEQLKKLSLSFDGVYADGLWALSFAVSSGKPCVAGTGLNVFNYTDLEELSSLGIKDVVFSKELSLYEIDDRAEKGYVFTRGSIGLMELIYCPFGKTCSSCKAKNEETLTDKTGHSFTVRRRKVNGKCRFLVENGLPLCSGKTSHNFFDFVGFSETCERDFYGESDDAIKENYSVTKGNLKRGVK